MTEEIEKETTVEFPIKVFMPNSEHRNINSYWERVITKWPFAYGIDITKRDNKCRITYNIDPNQLTPETYEEVSPEVIPAKVYELLRIKVQRDLDKMVNMMKNLKANIDFVSGYVPFIDQKVASWKLEEVDYEVSEFTPEDEDKEKQAEIERYKYMNQQAENKKKLDSLKKKRNKKK